MIDKILITDKIVFDNQVVKYHVSVSSNANKNSVSIDITILNALFIKNEGRLLALHNAILFNNDKTIQTIINDVKDVNNGKEVKFFHHFTCQESVSFDSMNFNNAKGTFFFHDGINLSPGATLTVPSEVEDPIRAGTPFSISGNN